MAAALLAAIEEWGHERGCAHVALDVHEENESARALYRAQGYEVRRHEMRKSLKYPCDRGSGRRTGERAVARYRPRPGQPLGSRSGPG